MRVAEDEERFLSPWADKFAGANAEENVDPVRSKWPQKRGRPTTRFLLVAEGGHGIDLTGAPGGEPAG